MDKAPSGHFYVFAGYVRVAFLLVALWLSLSSGLVVAQTANATHSITVDAAKIDNLQLGPVSDLTVKPGESKTQTTTWGIATNVSASKSRVLEVRLKQSLPKKFSLEVEARGDNSVDGFVTLTTSDQPLVTGLASVNTTGNDLVYRASVGNGGSGEADVTVLYTLKEEL